MLAIKLQRIGKKHQPSYRIVVAERRSKMAAPPVEDLGSYNPFTKAFAVKKDRVAHWMKMGAQPTVTAHADGTATIHFQYTCFGGNAHPSGSHAPLHHMVDQSGRAHSKAGQPSLIYAHSVQSGGAQNEPQEL